MLFQHTLRHFSTVHAHIAHYRCVKLQLHTQLSVLNLMYCCNMPKLMNNASPCKSSISAVLFFTVNQHTLCGFNTHQILVKLHTIFFPVITQCHHVSIKSISVRWPLLFNTPRGPVRYAKEAYEISKFRDLIIDFRISGKISRFHSRFQDFKRCHKYCHSILAIA